MTTKEKIDQALGISCGKSMDDMLNELDLDSKQVTETSFLLVTEILFKVTAFRYKVLNITLLLKYFICLLPPGLN